MIVALVLIVINNHKEQMANKMMPSVEVRNEEASSKQRELKRSPIFNHHHQAPP